jgi:hypothetical protein
MGALARGSAHARPSAQAPIDTSGHFSSVWFGGGGGETFWSERSALALGCWQKRRWPLFWYVQSPCAALGCWHKQSWPLF